MADKRHPGLLRRFRAAANAFRDAGEAGTWTPQSIDDLDEAMERGGGAMSRSGAYVSDSTALTFSAVYCAVSHISSMLAAMPLHIYRRVADDRRELARELPAYRLVHKRPNDEMTSFSWRETGVAHDLLQGNAYSQIIWNSRGAPVELRPMNPLATHVEREAGRLIYRYRYIDDDGQQAERKLSADEVLHIPGLGFNGRVGYSVVGVARESLGMGLSAQEYAARWYSNGMRVGGFLKHPGELDDAARENLDREMAAKTGVRNSHKWIVLEEDMDAEAFPTMSAEDAGFLMMLDGGVREVARWFKIPPHKLYELTRATYNNIEHQSLEYLMDAILPWAVRWEQAIDWKLLRDSDEYYAEFNLAGLLRADQKTQAEALEIERRNGIISADQWLALTNRNPIGGAVGGMRIVPANMANAEAIAKQTELAAQPPRTPEPSNRIEWPQRPTFSIAEDEDPVHNGHNGDTQ